MRELTPNRHADSPVAYGQLSFWLSNETRRVMELSASGFVVSPGEAFKLNDLVRLQVADPDLQFLDGWPARVVSEGDPDARCRFLKKSRERLETILHYVTPRISKEALKGRSRKRAVARTP